MLNPTIAELTRRTLLGRKRVLLLLLLPGVMILLATGIRWALSVDDTETSVIVDVSVGFLQGLALGTVVPLLGLIAGTGAIGPEIDDGSIVYLLSKPVSRPSIVVTKLAVAVATLAAFAAVPTALAGLILSGTAERLPLAFGIGVLAASVGYAAVFLLLAVLTRHAVVVGLIYALLWESLVGSFVPGARTLSIQQWGLSIADRIAEPGAVESDVSLPVALVLLIVTTVAATWLAWERLRSLTLVEAE